mgnify:CR=1 FL=1
MRFLNNTPIFSVNVFATYVSEWKQKKKEILSLVDFDNKDAASDEELTYTDHNLYGIKKDKKVTCPYRKPFLDMLFPYLNEFKENVYVYDRIVGPWCQRYVAGDYHSVHDHGAHGYSAVFYAKLNPDVHPSTLFTSPFPNHTGTVSSISPQVDEGSLIIFPAFLLHTAPPHKSDEDRIVFSFNLP